MSELSEEQMLAVTDALIAADEVLSILHLRGTKGVHAESSAGRIADVFHKVRAGKDALFAAPAVQGGEHQ